jgi:hypothetical protein
VLTSSASTAFGLWEKRSACFMCQREHCAKCTSLLSHAQIAGDPKLFLLLTLRRRELARERQKLLQPSLPVAASPQPEEFVACTKCSIVVTRQEKARMYQEVFGWGRKGYGMRVLYEEGIVRSRREMEKLFPRYSRLVNAISKEEGRVFDPFSSPKTVGLSFDAERTDQVDTDFINNYEA